MHVHPYKLLTKGYYRVRNSFYANFDFKKIIYIEIRRICTFYIYQFLVQTK